MTDIDYDEFPFLKPGLTADEARAWLEQDMLQRAMAAPFRLVREDKRFSRGGWLLSDIWHKYLYMIARDGTIVRTWIYPDSSPIKSYPEGDPPVILTAGEEDEVLADWYVFTGDYAKGREWEEKARLRKANQKYGDGPQEWENML